MTALVVALCATALAACVLRAQAQTRCDMSPDESDANAVADKAYWDMLANSKELLFFQSAEGALPNGAATECKKKKEKKRKKKERRNGLD